jgi:hypothetical protein
VYLSVLLYVNSIFAEFARLYEDYVARVPSDLKELLGLSSRLLYRVVVEVFCGVMMCLLYVHNDGFLAMILFLLT